MKIKSFFERVVSIIVTKEIFEDKKSLKALYKYFLIGILIRFIFMPFFFQRDLLSTYQRAAETIATGNFMYDFQQLLTNIIHTSYLFILKSIVPAVNEIFPVLLEKDTLTSWMAFNSTYNVFTVLTLFKVLYLIFDLACMFLILRLTFDNDSRKKLEVFKFWVFNPVVIFVLYIFARHDIIAIFVTLIALLLAKNDRKYWSLFVLAIGIALRFFPIMILPVLVFYLARTKKDYITLSLIGVSGLVGIELLSYFCFSKSLIITLLGTEHFDFLLSPKLDLVTGSHSSIFIFIAVYTIIVLSFLHIENKSFDILLNYGAIIFLAYIGICYFHPQYMLWAIPFLVILFVRRKSLLYYNWFQFGLLMIMLIYWGDLVTKFTLAPIDHKYFVYSTGIIPFINRFYDSSKFVNIFRSIFTGVCIWMIYLIHQDNKDLINSGISRNLK
ncbi:MAG: hypothetical protein PHG41_05145 [Actinomycetota bacterium]|nr:hypothetical protein [Actinomycetota bacterium]